MSSSTEEQLNSTLFSFCSTSGGMVPGSPCGYRLSIRNIDLPPDNIDIIDQINQVKMRQCLNNFSLLFNLGRFSGVSLSEMFVSLRMAPMRLKFNKYTVKNKHDSCIIMMVNFYNALNRSWKMNDWASSFCRTTAILIYQ